MAEETRVSADGLREFCAAVFERLDVLGDDAWVTADVLVEADLRGISSHGVARLRRYVNGLRDGVMVARPHTQVIAETPAKAVRTITRTKQFRIGVYLFAAYVIGYAAFILAGSYAKDMFKAAMLGMNVGTVSGIVLILATIGLAIGFNWYAGRTEEAS